jgi:hypothetical protein
MLGTAATAAIVTVSNVSDGAVGSLRQSIAGANAGDTINFATNLTGGTIGLTSGQLVIAKNLTIDASALAGGMRVSGLNNSRIFQVTGGTTVGLTALTLTNGNGSGADGGAVYNQGTLTINQCAIVGNVAQNSAVYGGGGIYNAGVLVVDNSTLAGNSAPSGIGGGIYNLATVTLNQCTLAGNSAVNFGGAIGTMGTVTVNQCTLTGNSSYEGGAIFNYNSGTLNLTNSIAAGNSASSGADLFNVHTVNLGGANLVQSFANLGTANGPAPLNAAPLLAPLGNYGGPTPTQPPLPGSPAIDAAAATSFATDQRGPGFPRTVGPLPDLGAVEFAASPVVSTNADAGPGSLRFAVTYSTNGTTLTFATNLSGRTIVLSGGQLLLNQNLGIDAAALAGGVQINGNQNARVFEIAAGASATLNALTIQNGNAPGGGYPGNSGGGILNRGTLTLTCCTVAGNQAVQGADAGGGGIENYAGTLLINRSTLSSNVTSLAGGGIENAGTLTVNECTLTGNASDNAGGGLYSGNNAATLNQSTLAGNVAGQAGGGVYGQDAVACFNSIVAGNSAPLNPDLAGALDQTGNNLIGGNPLLAPLGNYGGLTQTMPPLAGSPAIDAGAPTPFTTDQRGLQRVVGTAPDLGAVEANVVILKVNAFTRLGLGLFQISFSDVSATSFTVLATTNLALPVNAWQNLGPIVETPPGSGQFQFTDPDAVNYPRRFYLMRTP